MQRLKNYIHLALVFIIIFSAFKIYKYKKAFHEMKGDRDGKSVKTRNSQD